MICNLIQTYLLSFPQGIKTVELLNSLTKIPSSLCNTCNVIIEIISLCLFFIFFHGRLYPFFLIAHMFNFCMRLYFPPRFYKVSEKKYEKKPSRTRKISRDLHESVKTLD